MLWPYGLELSNPYQLVGVVASVAGYLYDMLACGLVKMRAAREYPQILWRVAADKCPLVVVIQGEDVVVGIEYPEKRYAQLSGLFAALGLAYGTLVAAILAAYAAVYNAYSAIGELRVEGLALFDIALEAMVEACYLVPLAHISVDIESRYGCAIYCSGLRVAAECCQKCSDDADDILTFHTFEVLLTIIAYLVPRNGYFVRGMYYICRVISKSKV